MLNISQNIPWKIEISFKCFARTFFYGLGTGRSCTGIFEEFLSPDEVIEIQKKMSMIDKEDNEANDKDV
jgi:hypothetical protein